MACPDAGLPHEAARVPPDGCPARRRALVRALEIGRFRSLEPDLSLLLRGGEASLWCQPGAVETLDVTGKVIAPGFVDILADNSDNPSQTFPILQKYKLGDGITTALLVHGGSAECAG